MKGRLRPGIKLRPSGGDTAPRMKRRPGMKGRLRPWEGTLHPGMELSPWGGETAPGTAPSRAQECRVRPDALHPGEDGCARDRPASPSGGHRVRAEALRARRAECALGLSLRPPGEGYTPDGPASPPEGAVSAWEAARRGRPGAGKFPRRVPGVWSDPEQSGATGGPR